MCIASAACLLMPAVGRLPATKVEAGSVLIVQLEQVFLNVSNKQARESLLLRLRWHVKTKSQSIMFSTQSLSALLATTVHPRVYVLALTGLVRWCSRSMLVHEGINPDKESGAILTPIVQSTTFIQDSVETYLVRH